MVHPRNDVKGSIWILNVDFSLSPHDFPNLLKALRCVNVLVKAYIRLFDLFDKDVSEFKLGTFNLGELCSNVDLCGQSGL